MDIDMRIRGSFARALLVASMAAPLSGCGLIKGIAVDMVADTLSKSGSVTADNDPELIGEAFPFTIKLYESLLESTPKNEGLLLETCKLATEYAYGYLQGKADILGEAHHDD